MESINHTALFQETIDGWASWGKIFQSIEAFRPLIQEIFRRHKLPYQEPEHLTPGTNAVFRVGEMIVKLYAPAASGVEPTWAEIAGMEATQAAGIPTAGIVCAGEIYDRYTFLYLVMNAVEGIEAGDWRLKASQKEKISFAQSIARLLEILKTVSLQDPRIPKVFVKNLRENKRWEAFPASLKLEAETAAAEAEKERIVFVHGDLTGENVLLFQEKTVKDTGRRFQLLDFGDCQAAPWYYEWPPIVFELFQWDPDMIRACFSAYSEKEFLCILAKGIAIHDFGGNFVKDLCLWANLPFSEMRSFSQIKEMLEKRLHGESIIS